MFRFDFPLRFEPLIALLFGMKLNKAADTVAGGIDEVLSYM
jgi:hypothetical protein